MFDNYRSARFGLLPTALVGQYWGHVTARRDVTRSQIEGGDSQVVLHVERGQAQRRPRLHLWIGVFRGTRVFLKTF